MRWEFEDDRGGFGEREAALAAVEIGKGVDGVAFDPTIGAMSSEWGRDGTISVVRETSPGEV